MMMTKSFFAPPVLLLLLQQQLLVVIHGAGEEVVPQPLACKTVGTKHSDGTWSYAARILVGSKYTDFAIDTASAATCTSSSSSTTTTNLTLSEYTAFPVGPFSTRVVPSVSLSTCAKSKKKKRSVLGLAPKSSLLNRIWASDPGLPHSFSYCLVSGSNTQGELAFGRTGDFSLYIGGDVLNPTRVKLVNIPLKVTSSSYQLELTGVGLGSLEPSNKSSLIQVGASTRYTLLPQLEYKILRTRLMNVAAKYKLKKATISFGGLDLCYSMTSTQVSQFPKAILAFGKQSTNWTIWPENYFVSVPNAKNVFCFAMMPANSLGVIGTFQQEENWIEYNLRRQTLGVSGNVPRQLGLSCASTSGT